MADIKGKIEQLANEFNQYTQKNGIKSPQVIDLVNFLRMQSYTDKEIEDVFGHMGYPIDMSNIGALENGGDAEASMKEEGMTTIRNVIDKKMNKDMRIALAEALLPHYKKKRVRYDHDSEQFNQVKESIDECTREYVFESKSNLFEKHVTKDGAERILKAVHDTGKIKGSYKNLVSLWKQKYSSSTDLDDLDKIIAYMSDNIVLKMKAAHRAASKLKIPKMKDYQIEYVENIAQIIVQHDLVNETLEYLHNKHKIKLTESTVGDFIKSAAIVGMEDEVAQSDNYQQLVQWTKDWLEAIPELINEEQINNHITVAVNMLANIHNTPQWEEVRERVLQGINAMRVDRNTAQDAIRKIDSGQKIESVSESMIRRIFTELIVNEIKTYG